MVIDSHAHVFPEKIADKAAKNIGAFYDLGMAEPSGSVELLLQEGDKAGIDRFLIHSVATGGSQVESANNFIARNVREHPGRFIGFATMHQDYPEPEAELERARQAGLMGVKLHPDFQHFALDDRCMFRTYDFCQSAGMPILFHMGDPRYHYSNPHLIPRLKANFPRLKLICAHFGGWSEWDEAVEYLVDTDVCVDCSSSFFAMSDERAAQLINAYGEDRVFFGSDFPMWKPGEELARLRGLPIRPRALEKIESENIIAFLGL